MFEKLAQIFKLKDLRNSILFVLFILIISRIAAFVAIPGIDAVGLKQLFASSQLLGMMNLFSGGAMDNFSIVMLGVGPYITSSIIFQLLTMVVPSLEELSKEGEYGRNKINMWTRWLTVPLAVIQAFSMIQVLKASSAGSNIFRDFHTTELIVGIFVITAGTIFMMWLGELISEKKIGNGISLLIFAGIVSTIPTVISQAIFNYTPSELVNMILFAVIGLITIVAVVIITEGQRNIPVQYARQVRGISVPGGVATHLPMRVNMAGVIPIIFAISIILVPSTIAKMFIAVKTTWVAQTAQWIVRTMDPQSYVYMITYFVLVVAFTYFYTAVIFHPDQIAENLQKQGGFVPGIRPGKSTAEYLQGIVTKIVLTGAVFLGVVAVLPLVLAKLTGTSFLVIGGTSLLIVVSVVIETVRQINSQLAMRDYDEI